MADPDMTRSFITAIKDGVRARQALAKAEKTLRRIKAITDRYAVAGQDIPVCDIREAMQSKEQQ